MAFRSRGSAVRPRAPMARCREAGPSSRPCARPRYAAAAARPSLPARDRRRVAAVEATPLRSRRADVEVHAAQDGVADDGRRHIAKAHAEHQRPWEMDPPRAAIDATLDPPRGAVGADQEW